MTLGNSLKAYVKHGIIAASLFAGHVLEGKVPFTSDRVDVGGFAATLKPDFRTNDPWAMHLRAVQLIVGEPGSYEAQIFFRGKNVSSRSFTVDWSNPMIIDFENVTPIGGIGGILRGEGYNVGWANSHGDFQLSLTRLGADGSKHEVIKNF